MFEPLKHFPIKGNFPKPAVFKSITPTYFKHFKFHSHESLRKIAGYCDSAEPLRLGLPARPRFFQIGWVAQPFLYLMEFFSVGRILCFYMIDTGPNPAQQLELLLNFSKLGGFACDGCFSKASIFIIVFLPLMRDKFCCC